MNFSIDTVKIGIRLISFIDSARNVRTNIKPSGLGIIQNNEKNPGLLHLKLEPNSEKKSLENTEISVLAAERKKKRFLLLTISMVAESNTEKVWAETVNRSIDGSRNIVFLKTIFAFCVQTAILLMQSWGIVRTLNLP